MPRTEKKQYSEGKLRRMGKDRLDDGARKQHRALRDKRRNRRSA